MERVQIELPLDRQFESALDALRYDIAISGVKVGTLEARLGRPSGYLSRRLSQNPTDDAAGTLTLKDTEAIIGILKEETGRNALSVVYYFINKHLRPHEDANRRAAEYLLTHLEVIEGLVDVLKASKAAPVETRRKA